MKIYTTKTTARITEITAELVKDYAKNLDTQCYVFCEDKSALALESEIARVTGGSFNINVTSLSRYMARFLNDEKVLSKTGSSLAVFSIMHDERANLQRLKLTNNAGFSSSLYKLIAQLKSAKVTPSEIEKIIQEEDGAFAIKLADINLIYNKYEKYLQDNDILDSNKFYGLIPNIAKSDEKLKNAKVVFAGFSSVTRQIMDIFESVAEVTDCDFVLLKGDGEFYTNEIYRRVTETFPQADIIEDSKELSLLAKTIEKGLFSSDVLKYSGSKVKTDKIHIARCLSPYDEAEKVAKRIRVEVMNGRRYKDFTICVKDPKSYEEIFRSKFNDFNIPLYVDDSTTMEKHPIIRLIGGLIDVYISGYNPKLMISLAGERLIATEKESQAFIKYVNAFAVSRRTVKKPFVGESEMEILAEKVRSNIIKLCSYFKKEMRAKEFSSAIESIIKEGQVYEKVDELCKKLEELNMGEKASKSLMVAKKIPTLLNDINAIIGDRVLSINECKSMLNSGAASLEVSILPLYNDMVFMGDFTTSKQRQAKILFAVGLSGDVPDVMQDIALLTDKDLMRMDNSYKCVVEPKIEIINRRERENVGVALLSFDEKLYMSYVLNDGKGGKCNKSQVVDDFLTLFDVKESDYNLGLLAGLVDESQFVYDYLTWEQGKENYAHFIERRKKDETAGIICANSFYKVAEKLGIANELNDIGETEEKYKGKTFDKVSATSLESYFACPYSAFLKHNLKLKEDENGEIKYFEFGNMLHLILQKFVHSLSKVSSENDAEKLASKFFEETILMAEYNKYLNKVNYSYIFEIVKKEAEKRCKIIYNEFQNSKYKVIGEEVGFGDVKGAVLPPITLNCQKVVDEKGSVEEVKVNISGKIDRLDGFDLGDGRRYIRIIDYKTGDPEEKAKDKNFYAGLYLQLYLYANAFKNEKDKIGGVYYYRVEDEFDSELGVEDRLTFNGKTLYSEDIAYAMDERLLTEEKNTSMKLSFEEKDGVRKLKKNVSTLTDKQLDDFLEYAIKISEKGVNEVIGGFIEPTPYDGSCKYCKFKGLCGYDKEVDCKTRKVEAKGETIYKAIDTKEKKDA